MKFVNNIFSISENETKTKNIIKLFGIKFTVRKKKFAKKFNECPYLDYKKKNLDITTLPHATGISRDVQLAGLYLLKEFDYICKQQNIHYWLDFGALLGAIRHKGFIPWDDDIDIGMMREDYNKLRQVFDSAKRDTNLYLKYQTDLNHKHTLMKVCYKKSQYLFLDIFPYDTYNKKLNWQEQIETTKLHKKNREKFVKNIQFEDALDLHEKFIELQKDFNRPECKQNDVIWGHEFGHSWKKWIHSYDTMFPLKEIEFEGYIFPCPNDHSKYLEGVYGNYMGYPKKIPFGHILYADFSEQELQTMKELGRCI